MKLLAWSSFLCGPVTACRVTGYMRGWWDLTISPGLVSYLLDGSWCPELPGVGCEAHAVNSSVLALSPAASEIGGVGLGAGVRSPSTFTEGGRERRGYLLVFLVCEQGWGVSRWGSSCLHIHGIPGLCSFPVGEHHVALKGPPRLVRIHERQISSFRGARPTWLTWIGGTGLHPRTPAPHLLLGHLASPSHFLWCFGHQVSPACRTGAIRSWSFQTAGNG